MVHPMSNRKTFDVEVTFTMKVGARSLDEVHIAFEAARVTPGNILVIIDGVAVKQLLVNEENFAR